MLHFEFDSSQLEQFGDPKFGITSKREQNLKFRNFDPSNFLPTVDHLFVGQSSLKLAALQVVVFGIKRCYLAGSTS